MLRVSLTVAFRLTFRDRPISSCSMTAARRRQVVSTIRVSYIIMVFIGALQLVSLIQTKRHFGNACAPGVLYS